MISRTVQFGNFVKWQTWVATWIEDPRDNDVSDRDAIDFAPFQLDEEMLQPRAPGRRVFAALVQGHSMVMEREWASGKEAKFSAVTLRMGGKRRADVLRGRGLRDAKDACGFLHRNDHLPRLQAGK